MVSSPSEVRFRNERLERSFLSLRDDDQIKKSIVKAIITLRQDAYAGIRIPPRQIPKEFSVGNLRKLNLVRGWRLLYTIVQEDEVELVSVILEWGSHKGYERRMGY